MKDFVECCLTDYLLLTVLIVFIFFYVAVNYEKVMMSQSFCEGNVLYPICLTIGAFLLCHLCKNYICAKPIKYKIVGANEY